MPISRVFAERSAERKLEIITAAPGAWASAQVLFGLGALVMVLGLALLAYHFRGHGAAPHMFAGTALVFAGSLLWVRHLFLRATDPGLFAEGLVPLWLFAGYSLLTMIGLGIIGWGLLQTTLPGWVGWMLIGSMALFLVTAVIFGDMPPFVYYAVMLVVAVALFRGEPLL